MSPESHPRLRILYCFFPAHPASPSRAFACLGLVSLFPLSLPSEEMEEKVKALDVLMSLSSDPLLGISAFTVWLPDCFLHT